jgi:thiamine biosynthesis lipoprotein
MRKTAQIMGTAVTIDAPELKNTLAVEAAFKRLREIDSKFSPYKKNSELSKYNRGELNEQTLSPEMKYVLHACRRWEEKTSGYFSAWYGGDCDPSGYVKGWAIAEAGKVLEANGLKTYCIYVGGDILARSAGNKIWEIAIQDPADKNKILNKLSISNGAAATSGNYERGMHIINPKTGKPAGELLSITITGPDIMIADILATAAFAMGQKGVEFVNSQKGYRALAIAGKVV